MTAKSVRAADDYEDCPGALYPYIRVTLLSGDRTDSNCLERAYAKYKRTVKFGKPSSFPTKLSATAVTPPTDWGAGSFPPLPGF